MMFLPLMIASAVVCSVIAFLDFMLGTALFGLDNYRWAFIVWFCGLVAVFAAAYCFAVVGYAS